RGASRVWAYGEPHDVWLRLDQRRVNTPVERLSNNQVIGFIEVGRDRNPDLFDQTNREGLIHNRAFEDLRRLAYFVLQAIEAERQSVRHPVKRSSAASRATRQEEGAIAQELNALAERVDRQTAQELRQLSRRLGEHLDRREEAHRQMVAGLSGLAAAGVSAGSLVPLLLEMLGRVQSRPR